MPSRSRRQFTTEQKVAVLRRHLVDKVPVSALCEEYKLQPSVFYAWQKQVFDNLASALDTASPPSSRPTDKDRRIEALEAKLVKKDNVIAEISEEFVALKKSLGEP